MSGVLKDLKHEAGVVSIMVTLVLMIVISLIVLGFAEISRNEQRSTLDDQLSTQAYYAAESGIDDARAAMNQFITSGQVIPAKPNCGNDSNYPASAMDGVVNAAFNVTYTCVTINPTPTTLTYNVGFTSTVIPVITGTSSGGSAVGNLTLQWKPAAGTVGMGTCPAGIGSWPISSAWTCNYPVLRVDLVDAAGTLSRSNWPATTATMFFVPLSSGGGGTISFAPIPHGAVVGAPCTAANCTVNITGMGSKTYYMRVTTLYKTNSSLTINAAGNKPFFNGQATIDSTGRAQDVLRRILVAVDLTDANEYKIPTGALVSNDSVCKRFGVTNGSFQIFDNMSAGGGGNALCNVQPLVGTPSP